MTRLSIDIPDDLRHKMETRAAETGHGSLENYVQWLVREDAESIDLGAPESVMIRSRAEMEDAVREGLASPAREMTHTDWDEMRRKLIESHRGSKAE